MFFGFDQLPDIKAAAEALAIDVVSNYPASKTVPELAQVPAFLADNPGSIFQYSPNDDVRVIWVLRPCSGTCSETFGTLRRQVHSYLAKALGEPITDESESQPMRPDDWGYGRW